MSSNRIYTTANVAFIVPLVLPLLMLTTIDSMYTSSMLFWGIVVSAFALSACSAKRRVSKRHLGADVPKSVVDGPVPEGADLLLTAAGVMRSAPLDAIHQSESYDERATLRLMIEQPDMFQSEFLDEIERKFPSIDRKQAKRFRFQFKERASIPAAVHDVIARLFALNPEEVVLFVPIVERMYRETGLVPPTNLEERVMEWVKYCVIPLSVGGHGWIPPCFRIETARGVMMRLADKQSGLLYADLLIKMGDAPKAPKSVIRS